MNCEFCAAAKPDSTPRTPDAKPRLPRGWKRHRERTYCDACWRARYVLRAVTIPVVRPLGDGTGWPQLRAALGAAWADSTACANWMVSELYARDVRRDSATGPKAKMPPMPKIYLYPEATAKFPGMATSSIVSMAQAAQRKWRARRYEVLWTGASSTPNYRYPYPATYSGQNWTASYQTAGKDGGDPVPCVSVPLRRGEERFLLQLRGGQNFRRQLAAFRQIVNGDAVQGEISLHQVRVGGSENRNGIAGRDSGGAKTMNRLMAKMVAWLPRHSTSEEKSGTLRVRSDVDAMLVALDTKDERLWWLNADHVRRWNAEHARRLHRLAEDQKHEHRQRGAAPLQSHRERICTKHQHRIDSFVRMAVAQLAGFAARRKFAEVVYDDSERRYLAAFAWGALKERLKIKLDECGIAFTDVPRARR